MSYLNTPRLTFSGRFQADPSTVNNDPTHFNNVTFNPDYQNYSGPNMDPANGWWNPDGTGNWRFIGCTITSVTYQDGTVATHPSQDPIIGAAVMDTDKRTAAKLVDLDSQQQMVSEIWGLVVRLVAQDGTVLLKGDYEVAPFTNIWFNRSVDLSADSAAGAIYQSAIKNLEWNISTFNSRYLNELQSTCNNPTQYQNQLSINFNVDRYDMNNMSPDFTLGRIAGAIGPSLINEPDHFVLGRQFSPATNTVNFGAGVYDSSSNTFVLDLGNSLQFSTGGVVNGAGDLRLVAVTSTGANPYEEIGKLNYQASDWYMGQSGLCVIKPTPTQLGYLQNNPLAIAQAISTNADVFSPTVTTGYSVIMNEATPFVRADKFVFRLNPPAAPATSTFSINFYVSNLGVAMNNQTVSVSQSGLFNANYSSSAPPSYGASALPVSIPSPNNDSNYAPFLPPYMPPGPDNTSFPPYVAGSPLPNIPPQPVNGTPTTALQVCNSQAVPQQTPTTCVTNSNGLATLTITFSDPGKARELQYYLLNTATPAAYELTSYSPNQYIDGQYYILNYCIGTGSSAIPNSNPNANFISLLIFSGPPSTPAPTPVTWETIQPIMQQYANLYPLMSKGIFNLADQKVVHDNAQILLTVFSKNMEDPNYMPATRDLSAYNLSLITAYLNQVLNP